MAGLSLNNDFSAQKGPPSQMSPPVSLQQQPFANLPPQPQPPQQASFAGKPGMMPVTQQPNAAPPVSRPPMGMNNNPTSYAQPPMPTQLPHQQSAATNGSQSNQAPPTLPSLSFNGSTNQHPSQVIHSVLLQY